MTLIDILLNVACLLVWLGFRASGFPAAPAAPAATLLSTLRRAEPERSRRWSLLGALAGILVVRALIYSRIGPAVQWSPQVDLGVVVLSFRGEGFTSSLLHSVLGFAAVWVMFQFALVLLSVANRRLPANDATQRLVRLHLGWVERLPAWVRVFAACAAVALAWRLLHGTLADAGALPAAPGTWRVWQQGAVVSLAALLSWKYVIAFVLLLHLANSYVYFGDAPVWRWLDLTSRNLLGPIGRLPLQVWRVDFAPAAGIALVWFAAHHAQRGLTALFQKLVV
jgi:uncharacterized protein YggT (Ycf19 family)